jgi:hypothetical protein
MKLFVVVDKDTDELYTYGNGDLAYAKDKSTLKTSMEDYHGREWEYLESRFKIIKFKQSKKVDSTWKSIDNDGQPIENGWYWACYNGHDSKQEDVEFYFSDGTWYFSSECENSTGFGNSDTSGEYYKKVK